MTHLGHHNHPGADLPAADEAGLDVGVRKKRKNLNTKFLNRVKTLDKPIDININSLILNVLEKKNRLGKLKLYKNNTKKEYLPKVYDPVLNSASRAQIKFFFLLSIEDKSSIQNYIEGGGKNKIRDLFLIFNNFEFEEKKNAFDRIDKKSLKKEIRFLLNLIKEFAEKATSSFNLKKNYLFPDYKQVRINPEGQKRKKKILLKIVQADTNNKDILKQVIKLNEIKKKVPRWSYKLIDYFNLEQEENENEEILKTNSPIRSRKSKRVVVFNYDLEDTDTSSNPQDPNNNDDETDDIYLIRYSQQSDFRRDIITGSLRAQRRKTVIWKAFEANVHSPTFLDRIDKDVSFSFDISETIKKNFQRKNTEFKILDYTDKRSKESTKKKANKREEEKRREKARIEIGEAWDRLVVAQVIRGLVLITQSILRKYIILPSLIIVKNIGRILLFQFPEWSEDLRDWKREMHVKCTYNGVQLSDKEFPKNWLRDGIQIKILFPFRLKPWHKSKFKRRETYNYPLKNKEQKNDFFFLTVFGTETELPFGSPRKQRSFFEPILKQLKKKVIKLKNKCFIVLIILKKRRNFFLNISKERKKGFIKNIKFIKKQIKELAKMNQILLFGSKQIEIYELNESKKEKTLTLIRKNEIIHESSINIESTNFTTFSLKKKKIQDLTDRRQTTINQIQTISKDNKKKIISLHINISFTS